MSTVDPAPAVEATSTPHKFCENCFAGGVIPGEPRGTIQELSGIKYYVTHPPSQTPKEGKAIVFITDAFGLSLVNSKLLSDQIAEGTGLTVFTPDVLEGDDVPFEKIHAINQPIGSKPFFTRLSEKTKFFSSFITGAGFGWIMRHTEEKVGSILRKFVAALREEKKYTRIGVVGYCLGGTHAIKIGSTDLVDVIVSAHPGSLKLADFEAIKSQPVSFEFAEEDLILSDKVRDTGVDSLRKKGNEVEVKIYPGTTHGFAARPDLSIPDVKKAFREALSQTINWFNKYL